MRTGWIVAALGAAAGLMAAFAQPVVAHDYESETWPARQSVRGKAFFAEVLGEHNRERDRMGITRLRWSEKLAGQAQVWADVLARRDRMEHARERFGAGENLWMGPAGYYSAQDMVGAFIDEKRLFRPGSFPDNSTTGRWADVGHYTQLIWRDTQELGCAIARNEANDFLVCRYWPAGNTIGIRVP